MRRIQFFGIVNKDTSLCESIIEPCKKVEEIRASTDAADWQRALAETHNLKRLYLFAAGDYHPLKLPVLLQEVAIAAYCKTCAWSETQ